MNSSQTLATSTSSTLYVDLQTYLDRIGITDTPAPTLDWLKRLHRRHEETIPFENLDVLLDRSISIELPDIERKLVDQNRGGYCFEQNTLFAKVLEQIGFQVDPFIARVRWMAPTDRVTALSHMVLRVHTDQGPYLADVGFGGVGLVEPIALENREPQHLDFEPRRIVENGNELLHQVLIEDEWRDVYQFTPTPVAPIDLVVGNWFSHTHPDARFRNSLLVARLTEFGRIIIADTEVIRRDWSGTAVRKKIANQQELIEILNTSFGLTLPKDTTFPLLEKSFGG